MRCTLLAAVIVLALLPACRRPRSNAPLAGESIGQYRVVYELDENTCGAGYNAPSSLEFYVELRAQPGTERGYWKLQTGPLVEGRLTRNDDFRFEQRSTSVAIPAQPANNIRGCSFDRLEVVRAEFEQGTSTIDGGVSSHPEGRLEGTTTITVTPTAGSDCTTTLALFGGPFATLPCTVRYDLEGERLATNRW